MRRDRTGPEPDLRAWRLNSARALLELASEAQDILRAARHPAPELAEAVGAARPTALFGLGAPATPPRTALLLTGGRPWRATPDDAPVQALLLAPGRWFTRRLLQLTDQDGRPQLARWDPAAPTTLQAGTLRRWGEAVPHDRPLRDWLPLPSTRPWDRRREATLLAWLDRLAAVDRDQPELSDHA